MKGFEPKLLVDLREVELGDWEHGELSRRAMVGDPLFQEVMREQRWELIPNAERATVFAERVGRGVLKAAAASGPDTLAVVYTHSAVIAEFCRQVTGSQPFAFMTVANGSITRVVRMPEGRWVLVPSTRPRICRSIGSRGRSALVAEVSGIIESGPRVVRPAN